MKTGPRDEIGVVVQRSLWVQVELMPWYLSRLERLKGIQLWWVQIALRPTYITTSKILHWWIPYVSIHSATNVITCAWFSLKQMWWVTKAMVEMKCEHWTKRWNWSSGRKLVFSASWTHGLSRLECRNGLQWSLVKVPPRPPFHSYFKNPSVVNTICIDSLHY